jgi:cytochrome b subunit of formate dehydrogenase
MKKVWIALCVTVMLLTMPGLVFAQGTRPPAGKAPQQAGGGAGGNLCPSGSYNSLCKIRLQGGGVVGTFVQVLIMIAVIVCLIFMITGGIRWITSGGDPEKVKAARSQIIAALVGMIIAFLSYAIIGFVLTIFTGKGLSSVAVPRLVP